MSMLRSKGAQGAASADTELRTAVGGVIYSEIMAMQDGLRALVNRVNTVKDDCKKAEADNEMLQTYIDSVTKSLAAKQRG